MSLLVEASVPNEKEVSMMSTMQQWVIATVAAASVFAVAVEQAESSAQPTRPAEKKTGYAAVNGLQMYYEITGVRKPAVYIHPILSHCGLIPRLTDNRQWIAMDLRGHGRTADIDRPMTCEQHADDIALLLKHLKVEEADFFGDSFGGTIAVMMTVRHPGLVRRVVSLGGSLAPYPGTAADRPPADSDLVKWQREEYRRVAPDPEQWPTLLDKATKSLIAWRGFSAEQLKAIKAPVLLVCGDHDLIPVERCAEWARMIPNAQLAVIPDASHFVHFSEPEKLLSTVASFLDAPIPTVPLGTARTGYYPGVTR
jgi:pimeloyl-ACP methyl ester carboxylesterase